MSDFEIFPEKEFPGWSRLLRREAYIFWAKWIGFNRGHDEAIRDIGELIDLALDKGGKMEGERLRKRWRLYLESAEYRLGESAR